MEKHDMETVTIGIDHGNAAVKTRSFRFPSGVVEYTRIFTEPPKSKG